LPLSSSGHNGSGLDTVSTLNSNSKSSQSWALDALGNQTQVTTDGTAVNNTVNSRNQKTAMGTASVTFDNNGNATSGVGGAGALTYDAWGDQIVSATCSTSRSYDALGRMIVSTVPDNFSGSPVTKRHDLYYDASWRELQDNATWCTSGGSFCTLHTDTEQYVWGQGYVDDLVLRDRNPDSAGFARLYAQQDANYNVTAITNTSGTVQERFVYLPYGQETTLTAAWATGPSSFGQFSTDSNAWIIGFQGWRFDSGTGFYTVRNRDYDVIFGWVGSNPSVYSDGMNPYQAFDSNPAGLVDATGLAPEPDWDTNIPNDPGNVNVLADAQHFADEAYNRSAHYWDEANDTATLRQQIAEEGYDPLYPPDSMLRQRVRGFMDENKKWWRIFNQWSDRCKELSTQNSKLAQWLNKNPKARYGKYDPPGGGLIDPNSEVAGVDSTTFHISRPPGVKLVDVARSATIGTSTTGHASPDTDPSPPPGFKDPVRIKGTSRDPIDTSTAKNGKVDAKVSALQAGALAASDASDELLNGQGRII
jgi:RHS repeat-associated protein